MFKDQQNCVLIECQLRLLSAPGALEITCYHFQKFTLKF